MPRKMLKDLLPPRLIVCLVVCLLHPTLSLECYDLVKCSRENLSRVVVCKTSSTDNCVFTRTSVTCPRIKGDSAPCNPDWFHGNCRCNSIQSVSMLRGKERCECDLDRKSIGIVAGVGLVAMVCAAAAVFYWKRWNKMKRVAQEARIETRVLSQVLENKAAAERDEVKPEVHRGGNAPGEGNVSEEVSAAAPPQYSESPQYSEPPQYSHHSTASREEKWNQRTILSQPGRPFKRMMM